MGGHGKYPALLIDPAIEKWYHMKESTHAYYRFNRRTAAFGIILTLVIPGFFYWGSSTYMNKVQPMGARRGEKLFYKDGLKKEEPVAAAPAEE
ncbi:uncharacterized protein EV422DRAFT_572288 [Fimicolochytrium jonesii]|uniref:uncharacterized protein n=1 Tax=Fimicolochytrium jonesii TaxID=1396493 RepID=UPI0022FEDE0B|nr:uncharacterized protein EV422DRAFT_572288 [Fimicolochytrium jonesii]KAI8815946.1 hypothetical protein EV422DRAFT_572288 [Fimicolochytrium jonesii]